jgi:hypothetical protein
MKYVTPTVRKEIYLSDIIVNARGKRIGGYIDCTHILEQSIVKILIGLMWLMTG